MFYDTRRSLSRGKIYYAAYYGIIGESSGVFFFDADAILNEYDNCVAWGQGWLNQLSYGSRYGFAADNNIIEGLWVCYGGFGAVTNDMGPEMDVVAEERGVDDEAFPFDHVIVGSAYGSD